MSEEIDKELLSHWVLAGIAHAGGDEGDDGLFATAYAQAVKAITEPCMKFMIPSFQLLPEGEEPQKPSIETRAAMFAHGMYLNDLEFTADLARWGIK